ncbi:PREDICTED: LOW QUALITY PROTEIN: basic helix-loop-helix and HMG box domain-containing protein 1 [Miniopterus natalensis]|uniref:LOW QUALITY PROTEIN: basic helix-loop-helix and HMG box domain-containing protein 1 n=1 Tax=Miniopterus natalensis TaxID=291302 RepID=UPI0007A72730|nr:PREDICTED: LOW QUALITY PROTEIN: basic helix-loop-helix and HMG box domain-containing protein 1 [Miniopterus natalensis]
MWGPSRYVCFPECPKASSLSSSDRTLLQCSLVEGEVDGSLSEPHGLREGEGWSPKGNYYQERGDWEVWESDAKFHFGCPNQRQFLSQNRKQRKNHTGKLHELALLLPLAPKMSSKKFTKKEILQHILHYIQYLQRNIDVAKALLKFHTSNREGGIGGLGRNSSVGSARQRHFTPPSSPHSCKSCLWGSSRKPRKKQLTRASGISCQWRENRTLGKPEWAQNPCCCLALDKPKKQVTPSQDQKGGNVEGTPPRCPDFYIHPMATSALPQGDRNGRRSQLTLLDVAKNNVYCDISSCCCKNNAQDDGLYPALGTQQGAERTCFLYRTQLYPRYKLVFYDSSEEVDKEAPDADPWLPAWTPEGSPNGSPLALGPPQADNWSVMGHPSEILGLSPSLFSSPGKMLPEQILEDGSEYLTQALFEEVFLDPVSSPSSWMLEVPQKKDTPIEAPEDLPDSHSLCQSSVSLDHLSLSEDSQASSIPSSEDMDTDNDTELVWRQQDAQADPEDLKSTSDEDGDYTWTPTRRVSTLPSARRKTGKGQAGRGPVKPKKKKAPCPTQTKKKCVNGFIMFCRMNRKQYIRACPGTASTAATKQLAQLWREMTEQERRPYSIKARRFSRQHNRIVKQESSSSEDEDWGVPKPFYQLLADRARCSSESASQLPSHHK